MWYVCDVQYAVLYVHVNCFVVCGCGVSRRYIDVCYCDMFSVVNVYLDHLKLCVLMVEGMSVVPATPACTWWNCPEEDLSSGKLELLCCCLPTPMALASGRSPMFPLVVHQPASPSI